MKKCKILLIIVLTCILPLGGLNVFAAPTMPDPVIFDKDKSLALSPAVSIKSTQSVYVDAGNSSSNLNTYDYNYIRVGKSSEFLYELEGLIRFDPITESQGGLLPDDAEITNAVIRLYKADEYTGTLTVRQLTTSFTENSVTWNTKPTAGSIIGSKLAPASEGWLEIGLPISLVEDWIANPSSNYGISLRHNWTDGMKMSFRSDEYSGFQPELKLQFTGAPAPEPVETTTLVDNEPCELTYSVTPESPSVGDLMTIRVSATDNQALSHVSILRGYSELARSDALTDHDTVLELTYTERATLPGMTYTFIADDFGEATGVREDITISVTGSGTGPEVEVTLEWLDVVSVIPEEFRLIENDGQRVRLTATAADTDGIETLSISINGLIYDYTFEDDTRVSQSILWENHDPDDTSFTYYASARDGENIYSSTDIESIDIARIEDIQLMWSNVPAFSNYSTRRLSWTRMVQVFGSDECWVSESLDWKRLKAWTLYHAAFKDISDGGNCFGFSTLALEMYKGRISPSEIEYPYAAYELDRNNSYTQEYIEARQGGQMGSDVITERISQWFGAGDSGAHWRVLTDVNRDLNRDVPGVLSIREDGGHAVVPWMTRVLNDGTSRIYIYDCNKVSAVRNASSYINNSDHYPFIELDGSDWNYQWDSSTVWNDKIMYFSYDQAIGNASRYNQLGSASDAPFITDKRLPNLIDVLVGLFGGDGDIYFEDSSGRITGVKNGGVYEEIPGSLALTYDMASPYKGPTMFIIPQDISVSATVTGNGNEGNQGTYSLGIMNEESVFSIEGKEIAEGKEDRLMIEPSTDAAKYVYTLESDTCNEDCIISMYETTRGTVEALDENFIGREFILQNITWKGKEILSMTVSKDADRLSLASQQGDISLDVELRSTEVLDLINDQTDYIPASVMKNVIPGSDQINLEPQSWSSTLEQGMLRFTGTEPMEDYSSASPWALEEIKDAKAFGLTTDHILNSFGQNITREEFCEIAVKLYEKQSGLSADAADPDTFTDTDNTEILKAYNLGIVKGVGQGKFAPQLSITRQEMCVMLFRTLQKAKPTLDFNLQSDLAFDDADVIADWALDEVSFMNYKGIMKGIGNDLIHPLGNTPREQAIVLVLRTYNAFK